MEHLEFVSKINDLGISIRSTKVEGMQKRVAVPKHFAKDAEIIIDGFELSYGKNDGMFRNNDNPLKDLIKLAIDMGEWKHSWHNEITPENYDKFQQIIQDKILDKAKEVETLLTIYFQINYEKSAVANF